MKTTDHRSGVGRAIALSVSYLIPFLPLDNAIHRYEFNLEDLAPYSEPVARTTLLSYSSSAAPAGLHGPILKGVYARSLFSSRVLESPVTKSTREVPKAVELSPTREHGFAAV